MVQLSSIFLSRQIARPVFFSPVFPLISRISSLLFTSCQFPFHGLSWTHHVAALKSHVVHCPHPCHFLREHHIYQAPGFPFSFTYITQVSCRWERKPYFSFKDSRGSVLTETKSKSLRHILLSSAYRTREHALAMRPSTDHPSSSHSVPGVTLSAPHKMPEE